MSQRKSFSIQTPPPGPLNAVLTDIKRAIDSISADYVGAGDLVRAGLLRRIAGGGFGLGSGVGGDGGESGDEPIGTPPAPTDVEVTQGYSFIMVEFSGATYPGHGYAQILRSLTNDYSSAMVVGQTPYGPYVDTVGTGSPTYYYWVRFVNIARPPVTGPPNSQIGIAASTAPDVQRLLDLLAGRITSSELDLSLRSPIEMVPILAQGLVQESIDRANAISAEAAARASAISSEATSRVNSIGALDAAIRADLATADQAVATSLTGAFQAADAATLASAQNYSYSKAQTDSAIAAQGTLLTTSFTAADAATLASAQNFTYSRSAIDSADAATLNTVRAEFAAGDAATLASAQSYTYSRSSIDSAIASSASTLRAQITGGSSSSSLGDITSGLVHQVNSASVSRDNALAQQITLLSAGAGEQFDYGNIWYFDAGIEGWSTLGADSALSAVDGWLRLVSSSGTLTDRNFYSPDNLGIDGARYPQVRLRVRRVGTPTWEGALLFLTTDDAVYNAAKSRTLAEPAFDANGISVITFDMPETWTGATIRRLRFDASTSISTTSYYELDWLAVGRPSPGASSAQLQALQAAMVSGDDANAQSIVNLSASLAGKADATALSALETRVTSAEGANTSQGTSITSLQNSVTSINGTVATKADTAALDALATRVTSAEGTITSQGTSITGLQSSVTTISDTLTTKADATALTTTNTNVTSLGNTVTAQAGQITALTSAVNGATAAVQTEATTRSTETGELFAKYTVKVDVAGHVSGFGLASTANNAAPLSSFGVRADQFYVAPPTIVQATAPSTDLYRGMTWLDTSVTPSVTRYYTGSAWSTTPQALPFIVQAAPATINGVAVPPGIYAESAFIQNGTITNAKIGDLAVDAAKIANLSVGTAKIANAAITTAKIGTAQVTTALIADAAITTALIANAAISSAKIADAAIGNAKIADLSAEKINVGTLHVDRIANGAITNSYGGKQFAYTNIALGGTAICEVSFSAIGFTTWLALCFIGSVFRGAYSSSITVSAQLQIFRNGSWGPVGMLSRQSIFGSGFGEYANIGSSCYIDPASANGATGARVVLTGVSVVQCTAVGELTVEAFKK